MPSAELRISNFAFRISNFAFVFSNPKPFPAYERDLNRSMELRAQYTRQLTPSRLFADVTLAYNRSNESNARSHIAPPAATATRNSSAQHPLFFYSGPSWNRGARCQKLVKRL